MELDDLKNTWNNANSPFNQQQHLTSKMIDQMSQRKYYSKIKKIAYPEIAGVIICLVAICYIGLNYYQLDTRFLQAVGMLSMLLLFAVSSISLFSLQQLRLKADAGKPYLETLKLFAAKRKLFYKLQKLNIMLGYLLLVTAIILIAKLFNGRDITESKYFWTLSFTIGYIFLLVYSKLVSKFYSKILTQSEELLLEPQS